MKVLRKVEDISFCEMTSQDVVRHPLVQKIVNAYEEYERREIRKDTKAGKNTASRKPRIQ